MFTIKYENDTDSYGSGLVVLWSTKYLGCVSGDPVSNLSVVCSPAKVDLIQQDP